LYLPVDDVAIEAPLRFCHTPLRSVCTLTVFPARALPSRDRTPATRKVSPLAGVESVTRAVI
jgi:hypothetical protein